LPPYPTQSTILDKGKGKEIETVDDTELRINSKKDKFLASISRDDDEKIMSPSKIANYLTDITKKFPNISQETLEKLSTPEGLKNRHKIIESLSEDELRINDNTLNYLSNRTKDIDNMTKEEVVKMDKIIQNNLNLDSEKVIEKLNNEFPEHKFDINSYKNHFMKATEAEINSGKTEFDKEKIRKEILEADLIEIQNTGGTSDIKDIRNVIRENYTHNSLLNEILNKGKKLQTLEDLSESNKAKFKEEILKVKPDNLIESLKNRSDYAEDSYIDSIITDRIDNEIEKMLENNKYLTKQEVTEKLIHDNPLHKTEIMSIVRRSMDKQIENLRGKVSEKEFEKIERLLAQEDLKEIQSLSDNRTEDQIRALSGINRSHNNLLNEIKTKVSQSQLKTLLDNAKENPSDADLKDGKGKITTPFRYTMTQSEIDQRELAGSSKSSFDTTHLEDTMNLFD
jgi:hypothetical protein